MTVTRNPKPRKNKRRNSTNHYFSISSWRHELEVLGSRNMRLIFIVALSFSVVKKISCICILKIIGIPEKLNLYSRFTRKCSNFYPSPIMNAQDYTCLAIFLFSLANPKLLVQQLFPRHSGDSGEQGCSERKNHPHLPPHDGKYEMPEMLLKSNGKT